MLTLSFGRPTVPGSSRGIAPLIIAALAAGGARAIYGAVSANQTKQKNKGYIGAAYRSAQLKLTNRQGDIRQGTNESLNARGLIQGGHMSAVRAAMVDGKPVAQGPAATTLGESTQVELGKEFASEQHDLDESVKRAYNENKADAINAQIGSVFQGVQTATSVYSMGKDLAGAKGAGAAAPSATRQAYMTPTMTGIDDPANSWGGVHPIDPLGAPGSSWNRGASILGVGQSNAEFNVGRG